jgi:CubicO group peptidase (beta-lactamase class C family)
MTLVDRRELDLATTARSVLGDALPLIDERVTVEQRLSHRSGIGDYLDESAIASPIDHVMPAGMHDTAFLRSDEPRDRTALGYLDADGLRTNVLHLPVMGSGDGGLHSTAADIRAFWLALVAGRIVSRSRVAEILRPRSRAPSESLRYGMGVWLHPTTGAAVLEGSDAGVSFQSLHDPRTQLTYTVLSNTTAGAWPIARHLSDQLAP